MKQENYNCKMIAHDTGDGWALMVQNDTGEVIGYLKWPESWPAEMTTTDLRKAGFEIV